MSITLDRLIEIEIYEKHVDDYIDEQSLDYCRIFIKKARVRHLISSLCLITEDNKENHDLPRLYHARNIIAVNLSNYAWVYFLSGMYDSMVIIRKWVSVKNKWIYTTHSLDYAIELFKE